MINLDNLNRQHVEIMNEVNYLETEITKGKTLINVKDTAFHISKLAGLLKIHLIEEDRFLYPGLLQCSDVEMKELARQYIDEMGNLADDYTGFKNAFNISSRITSDMEQFINNSLVIVKALKERIMKEDSELYYLVKAKKL